MLIEILYSAIFSTNNFNLHWFHSNFWVCQVLQMFKYDNKFLQFNADYIEQRETIYISTKYCVFQSFSTNSNSLQRIETTLLLDLRAENKKKFPNTEISRYLPKFWLYSNKVKFLIIGSKLFSYSII